MALVVGVIPTRDRGDLLLPLVHDLVEQNEFDALLVLDNSESQDLVLKYNDVQVIPAPGQTIYEMWNWGWLYSLGAGYAYHSDVHVAFLNDDIMIPDGFLGYLSDALDSDEKWWCVYPNYDRPLEDGVDELDEIVETYGTYRQGGLWGCAFMLKADKLNEGLPLFDESFKLWYGDDDLVRNIEILGGKVGRVRGLPLYHIGGGGQTSLLHPELNVLKGEDEKLWLERIGAVDAD